MSKDFLERPSEIDILLLAVALPLLLYTTSDLGLYDWLFKRTETQGFIYDFQVLFGGLLAFAAGIFVWVAAKLRISYEKGNEEIIAQKYRIYYAKEARDIWLRSGAIKNKMLDENIKSKTLEFLLFSFNPTFLKDQTHMRFFTNNEVRAIADLEMSLFFSNQTLNIFNTYIETRPDKPFTEQYNEESFSSLIQTSDMAKNISEILDPEY